MKFNKFYFTLIALLCSQIAFGIPKITRVEPLSWWTNMNIPLRILFYGEDLKDATLTVKEPGITIKSTKNAESPNYLFADIDIEKAGTYTFILQKGKKKLKYSYTINERSANSANRKSFTSADVIYLIMPDRFANGDTSNDSHKNTAEAANRDAFFGRHGPYYLTMNPVLLITAMPVPTIIRLTHDMEPMNCIKPWWMKPTNVV